MLCYTHMFCWLFHTQEPSRRSLGIILCCCIFYFIFYHFFPPTLPSFVSDDKVQVYVMINGLSGGSAQCVVRGRRFVLTKQTN